VCPALKKKSERVFKNFFVKAYFDPALQSGLLQVCLHRRKMETLDYVKTTELSTIKLFEITSHFLKYIC
jgi:hypothetical protein